MPKTAIDDLLKRRPELAGMKAQLYAFSDALTALYRRGGTLFIAGNGGSAADADHICGELLKGFKNRRPLPPELAEKLAAQGEEGQLLAQKLQCGLRAVSLLSHPALLSAFANDVDGEMAYAQQLAALGRPGDIFLGISTGGGARNIRYALIAARSIGITGALLTGNRHGSCEKFSDLVLAVPESETFLIQELHISVYHALCLQVEEDLFC